jgi:hypothetical protein
MECCRALKFYMREGEEDLGRYYIAMTASTLEVNVICPGVPRQVELDRPWAFLPRTPLIPR